MIGAGKAAASLALGLELTLGTRIDRGGVCVKYAHGEHLRNIQTFEAGHPVPDMAGLRGTREILGLLHGLSERDAVFVLLTGGASALLVAPVDGVSMEEKADVTRRLILSDAPIHEINVVRKHLSAVKGGRLRAMFGRARCCTLIISDVLGDDFSSIGSGPTVPDPSTYADALAVLSRYGIRKQIPRRAMLHLERGAAGLEAETPKSQHAADSTGPLILASIEDAISAATQRAAMEGISVSTPTIRLSGNTHLAARSFAQKVRELATTRGEAATRPRVLIAGGETTLVVDGSGRGGRNQEFALVAATELAGLDGVALLAAGTDGTDGPTTAAGAFIDGRTIERARQQGFDAAAMLHNNDSHTLFQRLGDCFMTGATGTNVMDLVIAIID